MSDLDPLTGDPLPQANSQPREMPVQEVLPVDLTKLSKDALIALVERMARQCGMVAGMSEEEIDRAFLDRMAHIGLTGKAQEALSAMEKRMDRTQGKPLQRVAAAIKSEHTEQVNIKDPDSLLDLARKMEFIMAKAQHVVKAQPARETTSGVGVQVIDNK